MTEEVRHTSATGGQKGRKPVELVPLLRMAPAAFLTDLGAVYAMGAAKYSEDNWRRGYPWTWSANALLRHLAAWVGGEDLDPESGKSHLAHVAWHAATLHAFQAEGLGEDDRSFSPPAVLTTDHPVDEATAEALKTEWLATYAPAPAPDAAQEGTEPSGGIDAPPPEAEAPTGQPGAYPVTRTWVAPVPGVYRAGQVPEAVGWAAIEAGHGPPGVYTPPRPSPDVPNPLRPPRASIVREVRRALRRRA